MITRPQMDVVQQNSALFLVTTSLPFDYQLVYSLWQLKIQLSPAVNLLIDIIWCVIWTLSTIFNHADVCQNCCFQVLPCQNKCRTFDWSGNEGLQGVLKWEIKKTLNEYCRMFPSGENFDFTVPSTLPQLFFSFFLICIFWSCFPWKFSTNLMVVVNSRFFCILFLRCH